MFKLKNICLFLSFLVVNISNVSGFTDLESKEKIKCLDGKAKSSNNELSSSVFGLKLSPNNSDKGFLIEFETDKKEPVFMVVGENQRFYDLNFFEDLRSEFNSNLDNINFESLHKYFSSIWKDVKDFKIGDKIKIAKFVILTVRNVTNIRLSKKNYSDVFSTKNNYIFFLSNINKCEASKEIAFAIESLFFVGGCAFNWGCVGSAFNSFMGFKVKKSFAKGAMFGAIFGLIKLIGKAIPCPVATQSGKVTLAKTDYLSTVINKLNDYNISFAKVEFIDDKNLSDEDKLNDLVLDEILIDDQNNPIKDEKGNTAHLFIVNSQGVPKD